MPKNVIMPALGVAQETGRVLRWLKAEGEHVTRNEMLLEIETDKATVELKALETGILRNVSAREGDEVPVGTVIAQIWAESEVGENPAEQPAQESAPAESSTPRNPEIADTAKMADRAENLSTGSHLTPFPQGRIPASPKARRLAAERGIDLNSLAAGGGSSQPVVASDVRRASEALRASDVRRASDLRDQAPVKEAEDKTEVGRVWRIMADRTAEAWRTIPHFYLSREVDAGALVAWREALQPQSPHKVTLTDLLIKKVATSLLLHPRLNSQWRNGSIERHPEINIGLAVGLDQGIVVPVIRDADRLTVPEIAAERSRLVDHAQTEKLRPEDISGGTFTISNLGMYGVDFFQAIVNPPQAAILAVGRLAQRLVPIDNQPVVRPMMTLSVSCDHRLVDGVSAAKFLAALADSLEQASSTSS